MNRVLVDTGSLVASLLEQDEHHEICVAALKELSTPLLTCWPMITEAAGLLSNEPEASIGCCRACQKDSCKCVR